MQDLTLLKSSLSQTLSNMRKYRPILCHVRLSFFWASDNVLLAPLVGNILHDIIESKDASLTLSSVPQHCTEVDRLLWLVSDVGQATHLCCFGTETTHGLIKHKE